MRIYNRPNPPVILALYGLPLICLSPNLTEILYSPGAVGKYDTETVPSLLSWQLISALLGPSTAKDKPPARHKKKYLLLTYSKILQIKKNPQPQVKIIKIHHQHHHHHLALQPSVGFHLLSQVSPSSSILSYLLPVFDFQLF